MTDDLNRTGRHLVVDGRADADLLRDRDHLERVLRNVAAVARMEVVDLRLYVVPEIPEKVGRIPFEDSGGVTGYAVLTTSHAAIHTFPLSGEYRFDLYSCKDFDPELVERLLVEHLRGETPVVQNWVR